MAKMQRQVTIIYYQEDGLELHYQVETFEQNEDGRVIIPQDFKEDKSIIAVCDGEVEILNKVGDRILSVDYISEDNKSLN